MFLSIRKYDEVYNLNSVTKKLNESFAPMLMAVDGFVRYCLVDIGDNNILSITTFETKKGMEQSEKLAVEWRKKHPEASLGNPTNIFHGEEKMWVLRNQNK